MASSNEELARFAEAYAQARREQCEDVFARNERVMREAVRSIAVLPDDGTCWQCDRILGTGPDACLTCTAKRKQDTEQ